MNFPSYEYVILVDELNNEIGQEEKLKAHQLGVLHRAFSVFVFNQNHLLLLQKRALSKYHSGGLWSNTCCGHPRPGETIEAAAKRRLYEEMGIECQPTMVGSFIYKALLPNNLIEHEIDHLFVATCDATPHPNPDEADDVRWVALPDLQKEIETSHEKFTVWFPEALEQMLKKHQILV